MLEELAEQAGNAITKANELAEKFAKKPHVDITTMTNKQAEEWGFLDDSNYTCEVLADPESEIKPHNHLFIKGKSIVVSITEEPDGTIKVRTL